MPHRLCLTVPSLVLPCPQAYPLKSLEVLRSTSSRIEQWLREEKHAGPALPPIGSTGDELVSEQLCAAAAATADALRARAVFCFTRRGVTASLLARRRPDAPIFAFTDKTETRQVGAGWACLDASALC